MAKTAGASFGVIFMRKIAKTSLYLACLPFVVTVLLEIGLVGLQKITEDPRLEINFGRSHDIRVELQTRAYQRESCDSVAIVGGSSAAGWGAEYSFGNIIDYELSQIRDCFFVKNFAKNGAAFNKFGAPLSTALIPYFDTIIVYSGHNEIWPQVYDAKKLGAPLSGLDFELEELMWEDMLSREIIEVKRRARDHIFSRIQDRLAATSLVYLLGGKVLDRLKDFIPEVFNSEGSACDASECNLNDWPAPLENATTTGGSGSKNVGKDFQSGAISLLETAEIDQTDVIFATVLSNPFWPPNFAVEGVHIDGVNAIDAFSNGRRSFKFGERRAGLHLLAQVSELDGFPNRVQLSTNEVIRRIPNSIDPAQTFSDFLVEGYPVDLFMRDFQHPKGLGHTLIAWQLLCRMEIRAIGRDFCGFADLSLLLDARDRYNKIYAAGLRSQSIIARNFLWHVKISEMSSALGSYLEKAAQILGELTVPGEFVDEKVALVKFLKSKPWRQSREDNDRLLDEVGFDKEGALPFIKGSAVVGRVFKNLGFRMGESQLQSKPKTRQIITYQNQKEGYLIEEFEVNY